MALCRPRASDSDIRADRTRYPGACTLQENPEERNAKRSQDIQIDLKNQSINIPHCIDLRGQAWTLGFVFNSLMQCYNLLLY